MQTSTPLDSTQLKNWSEAQILKSEYSKIIGEAKFQGSSLVAPAKYITFQSLGNRFSGNQLISGVSHDLSEGNWMTTVNLGLSSSQYAEVPDVKPAVTPSVFNRNKSFVQ